MTTRVRTLGRCLGAHFVPVLLAVLTAGLVLAGTASASGPALTVAGEPLVNWKWLAVGLGGAALLVVLMWVLQRFFFQRRDK